MSRFPTLPVEILDRIISFISNQQTLASLSRTNQLFRKLTEPHLYESITLKPGAAPTFESAISNDTKRKSYVKEVHVDYVNTAPDAPTLSACTHAPLYSTFHNLEALNLYSGFWHWDDSEQDGRERVLWDTDQNRLTSLFEQAGLSKPVEERIWTQLRVVTLDLYEQNGQGWYCPFEPAIFLVPSLEELTLRGCRFWDGDGNDLLNSPYRGTTALKKLALERSYIYHTSLYNFLTMPKALTHLSLEHYQSFWHHEMGNQPETSHRVQDYMNAFKLHQHSLQSLFMNGDMCSEIEDGIKEREFDFSSFPELSEINFDEDILWMLDETKCIRFLDED
jgi:hypothetical protein